MTNIIIGIFIGIIFIIVELISLRMSRCEEYKIVKLYDNAKPLTESEKEKIRELLKNVNNDWYEKLEKNKEKLLKQQN